MKNISLILNGILLLAVAHLYYLNLKKPAAAETMIVPASSQSGGAKIAYVNADTLNENYTWLKEQKAAMEQKLDNSEAAMRAKQEAIQKAYMELQEKAQSGKFAEADLRKEAEALDVRARKLDSEASQLDQKLREEQQKTLIDLYANLEAKLKELQNQIGYDYILSYSRGGQILMAKDSLDITKQVLQLLNSQEKK